MLPNGVVQTTPGSGAGIVIDVTAGSTSTAAFVDMVVSQPGSVAGTVTGGPTGETVYLDANNNGTLDQGEISTTAGTGGAYTFSSVPVGTYTVRQILPTGYSQTFPAAGAGIAITVASGSNLTGKNFTDAVIPTTGTVAGAVTGGPIGETVYLDANNNGKLDPGELLRPPARVGFSAFRACRSGPSSSVRFCRPGTRRPCRHRVRDRITVAGGSNLGGENFTDTAVIGTGSVAGTVIGGPAGETVYLDANGNSQLDSGESSTTTGTGGVFSFNGVPIGSYTLRQILTGGFTQTAPAGGAGIALMVATGASLTGENFTDSAAVSTGNIAIHLFNDANGDGIDQNTESPLNSFGTYLDLNNDHVFDGSDVRHLSDTSGNITFSNLPIGTYRLEQNVPAGYTVTTPKGSFRSR